MFRSRFFPRLSLALCGMVFVQAGMADSANKIEADAKAQGTKVSFAPPERAIGAPSARQPAAAIADGAEFVFSAPPRGSYAEEVAVYQPIVEYLSRVTGRKFRYQYSDNWLSYSKDMTNGNYDLVFDGPAFNGWRMEKMSHTPLIKLPEDFVFVVIARKDNLQVTELKQLAGRKVCVHAPPNLGTLTLLSQFDNPMRQPSIVEIKGWDVAYQSVAEGKCAGTVLPIKNLEKNDKGLVRVLYKHKPLPNQALSAGPRIPADMQARIKHALLSDEGRAATTKLRATYAGKDFIAAEPQEYAGLGTLLKDSLYYY